ncbi:MAG TPA: tetraacyldisaccharide 4'-kinase [Gemmatimonadota bacterium]|nr:tetraacyldisaccharide 4'-kinase [Gemmatimonadota bacterium]
MSRGPCAPSAGGEPGAVVERAAGYGWARRTLYGEGGWSGAAWRGLARPLGWGWRLTAERRLTAGRATYRLPAPAIAVGNVTVGGGGKTSLVLWILANAVPFGAHAAVLTRGYGRSEPGAWVIAPGELPGPARAVGDEPLLLARAGAWVGVAADRARAARALGSRFHPDVFLLDDALQHRQVARALDLVTFTVDDLVSPARCLPAGPLRQGPEWLPPNGGWVVAGGDPRARRWPSGSIGAAFSRWWTELPGTPARWADAGTVTLAAWRGGGEEPYDPGGRRVVAFVGVARPGAVARFAAKTGLPVERVVAYRDHQPYRAADIAALLAEHPDASFVTTEKDAIKCDPEWFEDRPVGVLRRRLDPFDPELLKGLVREAAAWPR